ncbi:SOUL family heme-binding protein [Cyclobacterium jeungdonense]|uniref:Heme-binding protein n=1 Tax=Cyclobacterium jeungdonense TaxID=708087 RepID=A0ABT8CCB3_9BACT|nr:heme-binding protein [Cyclobacterium jeungdonense]MDN3690146.1 heme-binding protein [Cyclobacterium jeungdonense]
MKLIVISLGIILFVVIVIQLYAMTEKKNTETYPYRVLKKYEDFELRTYEARLFTSVKLSSDSYKAVSNRGFSILAGYIFGGNEQKEKIAMTTPVAMSLEDSMTMMFMIPKKYSKETLPQPDRSEILFREEPAKTVAAIRFGGWASDEKIAKYKTKLIDALAAEEIAHTNQFFFLGYNAPFEMVNRRNEVIVELEKESFDE